MQRALAGRGEIVEREVAVRDRVETVARRLSEAQRFGGHVAIEIEAGACKRGGSQRAFVHPALRIGEARTIAHQHLEIGEQMVTERNGLRGLQMREAGHDAVGMFFGARHESAEHCIDPRDRALVGGAHPHAEIGRDLVVAAARGVQPSGHRADDFGQSRFHGHVDVFEVPVLGYAVALVFGGDLLQTAVDGVGVLLRDDTLPCQHRHMRATARDILAPQHLVERDGGVDFAHDRARSLGEPSAPHAVGVLGVPLVVHACHRPRSCCRGLR